MAHVDFSKFIAGLIQQFSLPTSWARELTSINAIKTFMIAFTHSSFDSENNYEPYEQIGDATIGKFMVNYFYARFPNLSHKKGVKYVARLRIKYGSKQHLSHLATQFGFERHIRCVEMAGTRRILEDVFEAFIGAVELILDVALNARGIGYICCYQILEKIFGATEIPLTYEDLFDAKTRLKELFDSRLIEGAPRYEFAKQEGGYRVQIWPSVAGKSRAHSEIIGEATMEYKADAEQAAAAAALKLLKSRGISKQIPIEYL